MIVEERNYLLVPGGAGRYLDAWYRLGRGPQVAHLGEPLGVYTVEVGDLNTLVYLWSFTDQADRANRRAGLAADAGFAVFRGEVRSLLVSQTNRVLVPAEPPEGST
ncbi:NIPSNAP family protein [Lentzea aerocolonigenes]|uniref:NIPSNAP family protein n=1 Tax=Lentzea aerocolonigenes TaxID=68170 RepID=UPI0004C2F7F4|nr:NIPSNAP family protein [Lentzea aerocolonigenes]MCP2244003.1 NIPSNAP protein [Lentzea aerocolonigenes]